MSLTKEDLEILKDCKVYPYRGRESASAKEIKIFSVLLLLLIIIGAGLIFFDVLIGVVCIVITTTIMFAYIIYEKQIVMMRELTQFFRDENGDMYKITFTYGASHSPISALMENDVSKESLVEEDLEYARLKEAGYYYVKRFRQGYKDWNAYDGGPAKVLYLPGLTLIKRGRTKSRYTYIKNGRTKRISISNAYKIM